MSFNNPNDANPEESDGSEDQFLDDDVIVTPYGQDSDEDFDFIMEEEEEEEAAEFPEDDDTVVSQIFIDIIDAQEEDSDSESIDLGPTWGLDIDDPPFDHHLDSSSADDEMELEDLKRDPEVFRDIFFCEITKRCLGYFWIERK